MDKYTIESIDKTQKIEKEPENVEKGDNIEIANNLLKQKPPDSKKLSGRQKSDVVPPNFGISHYLRSYP